ncbi:MAG TPA: lysylphosphatidylglycerol synthase transmembrane domain-containing protein [Chthoniobacteraceae bacterium]|jgi:hypothetical protein|nr:lysylphosphatidylglycerol synthase transmembrane domain-containing protein [Chthoniobacteraceae bacterium]
MKKKLLTALQVLVTVGILCWVFHDPQKRAEMWQALMHAKPSWLVVGFICYGIVELLAALRWYILMRVQGIRLPLWRVGALFMLGIFFNTFMPGATGGDVLKVFFLFKEIPDKKEGGLLAVLMDRLIGLTGLIIISSVIVSLNYHWLSSTPQSRHLTWVLMAILASGLGGITLSFLISGFKLAHKLPEKMPLRDKLIDTSKAYHAYALAWPSSLSSLVLSWGVHLFSFSVFICAARALSINIPALELLTVMPIILTISAMPISVGGTGVREGLFAMLLGPLCGVNAGDAITLSLTGFMLTGAWAVIGGGIYLFYRSSDHRKLSDVERQVHEVEHEVAEN